jgi:2-haloacid dehalogenase
MIDGIKALTFDTGGTILDWHTGIETKLRAIGARDDVQADWAAVTNTYRRRSLSTMSAGAADFQPAFNIDHVHREQIEIVAREHGLATFTAADFDDIRDTWHSLACWPDVPAGLARLRAKYLVASLTILSFRLIMDTCKPAGIVWDAVFSCEAIGFYKLRPQAYQRAAQWLQVDPEECMMVAAHPSDLAAAARVGYRTAFVRRPTEWGHGAASVEAPDDFRPDITVDSFGELADELGAP